jgi:hypothetical protein
MNQILKFTKSNLQRRKRQNPLHRQILRQRSIDYEIVRCIRENTDVLRKVLAVLWNERLDRMEKERELAESRRPSPTSRQGGPDLWGGAPRYAGIFRESLVNGKLP